MKKFWAGQLEQRWAAAWTSFDLANLNNVEPACMDNVEPASLNNVELASLNNVELVTMNNVELTSMNNVELANMNNVLASMFYRFPTILLRQERTILFIDPLNGQPHLILIFIFCRKATTSKMIKSNLKYCLQREFWRRKWKLTVKLYSMTMERLVISI